MAYVATGKRSRVFGERPGDSVGDGQEPSPNSTQPVVTPRVVTPANGSRPIELTRARFLLFGSWEGVVEHVGQDTFTAYITDTYQDKANEVVEFYKSDLSEEDLQLLEEGAVFYWFVGYNDSSSGQRSRTSVLRIRRLPPWTEYEHEKARSWADETTQALSLWQD